MSGQFSKVAMIPQNPKWEECIRRQSEIYNRHNDIRSEFSRDYNRILHSTAYRRLKHKTQVFFATKNDHICTRIEHVNHVSSVSYTIAKYLGLNTELVTAIAIGHDLGHAPFGHAGETIIKKTAQQDLKDLFWHEKNSLRFVDQFETLPGPLGKEHNLNLTYAVRDGIISHCGEVDDESIYPRDDYIDLESIMSPSQYSPYSWEGCVVKISDKIAYLGRDIEDALNLRILTQKQLNELIKIIRPYTDAELIDINNTVIMHDFIIDICNYSSPESGIRLSKNLFALMKELRQFSSTYIYKHERLAIFQSYAKLIIQSIYNTLKRAYKKEGAIEQLSSEYGHTFPLLTNSFADWLKKYSKDCESFRRDSRYNNKSLYDLKNEKDYIQAIVDYISSMTDSFAIRVFNELTSF